MDQLNITVPPAFKFMMEPHRYKVVYGGRGSGKSWTFAILSIAKAISTKTRILCCRETQNSIKESTHKIIADQINRLGVGNLFDIGNTSIRCKINDSEFIFMGLLNNVDRIKSTEGVDICIVNEAENISEESWNVLTPTIRNEGSEIWVEFNTRYADDPTYKKFISLPPKDCVAKLINWDANPYFPTVLAQERLTDFANHPGKEVGKGDDFYENKWNGAPLLVGGRIWTNFDPSVHIKDFGWDMLREKADCFMVLDPHQHYYHAAIWIARFPKNNRGRPEDFINYVYNEWPKRSDLGGMYSELRHKLQCTMNTKDIVQQLEYNDKTAEHGLRIFGRFIDTRFAKATGSWSSYTEGFVAEYIKEGMTFNTPREGIIDIQRARIITDLTYNKNQAFTEFNSPSLYVAPWCHNMIESLNNHRLLKGSETEDEKYKDFSDALRICYAGMVGRNYVNPITGKRPEVIDRNNEHNIVDGNDVFWGRAHKISRPATQDWMAS